METSEKLGQRGWAHFWRALGIRILCGRYPLNNETPWKILNTGIFCSLVDIFIHHIVIEYLLCARHCERD